MSTPEEALQDAVAFLRAGGTIGPDRWGALGPASKRLYGLAAEVVERERAIRLAAAIVEALKTCSGSSKQSTGAVSPAIAEVSVSAPSSTHREAWVDDRAPEILQAFGPEATDDRAARNAALKEAVSSVLRNGGAP